MSKLKDWLSANEIYFRTLSAIMFGASALFVSLASYIVSSQQLRLSEVASKPHFYALHKYKRNETSGFSTI